MEVESSLASLLEKLKVEDPWLPPRSWESIPSQSGRSPPRSRVSASSSSSSSVSESSLVRLALNALQGVESALISIEKLSSVFYAEPADRTFHKIPSLWNRVSSTDALGGILRTIGYYGSLVFLLHRFVDHFTSFKFDVEIILKRKEDHKIKDGEDVSGAMAIKADESSEDSCFSYSLVNQAFAIAVRKVLEGYTCVLDILCASAELRRLSSNVGGTGHNLSGSGCLTNVVHSKITLLEVFLHTREIRTQIEALANICDLYSVALLYCDSSWEDLTAKATLQFHKFFRGADLLSYLYSQLNVADPSHRAMLKFLFLKACEPYCGFIRSWIFKAQINDPFREFIVEGIDEFPPYSQSKPSVFPLPRVREREGVVVPCFLKGFLVPLVRAGQQLQVIVKLLELCKFSASGDHKYADLLPCWTHYSSTSGLHASPVTFSKKCIEAMGQARDNYYRSMQEKLGDISEKLELFSEQAVEVHSLSTFYSHGRGNVNSSISFTLGDSSFIPPTAERDSTMGQDDLDSDDQNTEGRCFLETDASDSSEGSSTGDSEEAAETALVDLRSTSFRSKQNYLSALSFSVASADNSGRDLPQLDKSYVDNNFNREEVKTYSHGQLIDTRPMWSTGACKNNKYMDSLSVKPWPLGSLRRNPFYSDKEMTDSDRAYPFDSGAKMGEMNAVNIDESMPFSDNIRIDGSSSKEKRVWDWPENSSSVNSFLSKDAKANNPCNVLSMNPVLMKTAFSSPVSKHQDPNNGEQGKLLPTFDFSVVDDPCRVCFERLSVGSSLNLHKESDGYLTKSECGRHADRECGGDKFVVKDPELSFSHLPLDLEGGADEDKPNATGGCGWGSLLGRSNNPETITVNNCRKDSFGTFEVPLDFVIDRCLLQEILLQYNFVSKLTIRLLEEGFGLQEHLLALRRYHFMELADWADLFIISLWHHKCLVTEADQRIAEIQGFLKLSIQRSSCELDAYKDRLFVYMKRQGTMPLQSPAVGVNSFDFLGLGYRVDWPVSIILTCDALKAYADVFSFLIQVKLAAFSLTDIWRSLKDARHMMCQNKHEITEKEFQWINVLMKLRHQVNHFVSTLQQYVQSELSHVSWSKFLHSLKHKVKDMMDLELVHMAYLNEALRICFLSDETRAISSIIENILQCALDFRSCLPRGRGFRSTGQHQTDLLTKFLGVNTSQVMAIKEKFDKHIKELHLYYLRSPKHTDFRLSGFWGYLNFNQYYSEILNETNNFAFVI